MKCLLTELCEKEIINLRDGARLGNANDFEIEAESGKLLAVIISPKSKMLGFGEKPPEIKIMWQEIQVVGDDTILVDLDRAIPLPPKKPTAGLLSGVFREG